MPMNAPGYESSLLLHPKATHALAAVLHRHGVRDHEAYIGDRTYDSLIAFADNLAFSAGQPHHYVRCGPAC